MLLARHLVEWHGDHYTIEPLKSISRLTALHLSGQSFTAVSSSEHCHTARTSQSTSSRLGVRSGCRTFWKPRVVGHQSDSHGRALDHNPAIGRIALRGQILIRVATLRLEEA
jgi:hypothetical protein